mmetsp:Transcript_5197/g.16377  ORF Transcript_5197/g.16377 Transcript_5197/m.16377 type:complete len:213 (-) Transcript_5197:2024-2662(-)
MMESRGGFTTNLKTAPNAPRGASPANQDLQNVRRAKTGPTLQNQAQSRVHSLCPASSSRTRLRSQKPAAPANFLSAEPSPAPIVPTGSINPSSCRRSAEQPNPATSSTSPVPLSRKRAPPALFPTEGTRTAPCALSVPSIHMQESLRAGRVPSRWGRRGAEALTATPVSVRISGIRCTGKATLTGISPESELSASTAARAVKTSATSTTKTA